MLVAMNVCIIWVRVVKSKVTLISLTLGVWVLCICIVCTTYPRSNPLLVGSSLSIAVLAPVSWFREIRLPYPPLHYQEVLFNSYIYIYIYTYTHNSPLLLQLALRAILLEGVPGVVERDAMAHNVMFFSGLFVLVYRMYLCVVIMYSMARAQYYCLHFSMCACHPCAGAMLIFSASFQC